MTVKEIVKAYLKQHKLWGLHRDDCSCRFGVLMSCDRADIELCEEGYFRQPTDGGLDETVVNCVSNDGDRYNRLDVDWERMEQIVHDIVPYLGREDIKGNVRALLQLKARIDELFSMMEGHAENVHGDWNKDRLDWLAKTLGLDYASRAEKKAEDEGLIPKEESDGKR